MMNHAAELFLPCRDCVSSALRRTSRAVTRHYEFAFRGSSLRSTQFSLLATLIQTGPIPLTRLAAMTGLERTSLTRNLGLLEGRRLVSSDRGTDGRVRTIAITEEGEKLAVELLPLWKRAQAGVKAVLADLPPLAIAADQLETTIASEAHCRPD
jgi:DNA-binding MarR family transcriptional regulator